MQSISNKIITSFLTSEEVEILTKVSITLDYDIDNFRNASEVLVDNDISETNESETDLLLLSNAKYNMLYYINEELKNYINCQETLRYEIDELREQQEQLIDENDEQSDNEDYNNYDNNMVDLYDEMDNLDLNDEYYNQNSNLDFRIEKLESELIDVEDRLTELHQIHDAIYYTSF
jgi:hypothetical protein